MDKSVSIIIYPRSYNKRGDVSLHSVQGVTADGIEVNIKLRVDGRCYPFGEIPSIKEFSRTDIKAKNACVASASNCKESREGVLLFADAKLDLNNRRGIPSYVARWGQVLAIDSDADSPLIGFGRFFCDNGDDISVADKSLDANDQCLLIDRHDNKYTFEREYGYLMHLPDQQFECYSPDSDAPILIGGDYLDYLANGFLVGFSIKGLDGGGAVVKETYREHFVDTVSASLLNRFFNDGFDKIVVTPILYKKFKLQKDRFLKSDEDLNNYIRLLIDEADGFDSYKIAIRNNDNPLYSFFRLSDSVCHPARLSSDGQSSCWFSTEPKPEFPIDGAIVLAGTHGAPISRSLWLIADIGVSVSARISPNISDSFMEGSLPDCQADSNLDFVNISALDNDHSRGDQVPVAGHFKDDVDGLLDLNVDIIQSETERVDLMSDMDVINANTYENSSEVSDISISQGIRDSIDVVDRKPKKKGMADFIRR